MNGLVFDAGDVLFDATLWRRWLYRLLSQMGPRTDYQRFFGVWDRDFLDDVHRGCRRFDEAFYDFLLTVGLTSGQADEVQAASNAKRRELDSTARTFPGVRQTLACLHASGVKLGVLQDSNLPADELEECLDQIGLTNVFEAVVSSYDLGCTKPDRACYLAVLNQMSLSPSECAFVGHDRDELAGAAEAGMRTIAFNHGADAEAERYAQRFEELVAITLAPWEAAQAG